MKNALFILCMHALMCALSVAGFTDVVDSTLAESIFTIGILSVIAIGLITWYLYVDGNRLELSKFIKKGLVVWLITFSVTSIGGLSYAQWQPAIDGAIQSFIRSSPWSMQFGCMLATTVFVALNIFLKKFFDGSDLINNILSRLVRKLAAWQSAIFLAFVGNFIIFMANAGHNNFDTAVRNVTQQDAMTTIGLFWISVALFITLMVYGDKFANSLKSSITQALVWLGSFLAIAVGFTAVAELPIKQVMSTEWFMLMVQGGALFILVSIIYGLLLQGRYTPREI